MLTWWTSFFIVFGMINWMGNRFPVSEIVVWEEEQFGNRSAVWFWVYIFDEALGCPREKMFHAAATAKWLQSCPTLCDPMDCSLPGYSVHGILQARTLEWVAISFSDARKWKVKVKSLSRVQLLATPWTAAHQAPPSMGYPGQQYWSGVPLPSLECSMGNCIFGSGVQGVIYKIVSLQQKDFDLWSCGFLEWKYFKYNFCQHWFFLGLIKHFLNKLH